MDMRRDNEVTAPPVALITGASRGLGLALARDLAERGWALVLDAREPSALDRAARELAGRAPVRAVAGDVADEAHRVALVAAAVELAGSMPWSTTPASWGPAPSPGWPTTPWRCSSTSSPSTSSAPCG